MCGIVQLEKLISTVSANKISAKKYTGTIQIRDPVFIYVKNYCPFSKRACECLKGQADMTILDMVNEGFVKYKNGDFKTCDSTVPNLLIESFKYKTVPQVFCFVNDKWNYIGECEDVLKLNLSQGSTPQHSIPTLKM